MLQGTPASARDRNARAWRAAERRPGLVTGDRDVLRASIDNNAARSDDSTSSRRIPG